MRFLFLLLLFPLSLFASWADRYPELKWLADDAVIVTGEGISQKSKGWSVELFGKHYPEFDRSCLALHALDLVLQGDEEAYNLFVKEQKDPLSKEHFKAIHLLLTELLEDHEGLSKEEILETLRVTIVLGDLGKSLKVKEHFNLNLSDHDLFYEKMIEILHEHPEKMPSYAKLPQAGKELIYATRAVGHYGHMTHLEGGSEIFYPIKLFWDRGGPYFSLNSTI